MEFNIKLDERQYQIVMAGLGELRAKDSIEIIQNINSQVQKQIMEQKKKEEKKDKIIKPKQKKRR